MTRKIAIALAALLIVFRAPPAAAQEGRENRSSATEGPAGTSTTQGRGGFQLVTHGIWPSSEVGQRLTPAQRRPQSVSQLRASANRMKKHRPNFWRAIYLPQVQAAEKRFRLPPGLLDALIWTESRYNPFAVSAAGAAGLGQIMPETARDLGLADRFDPKANLWRSGQYLRQMLDRFGSIDLALAAYNAGPGAVFKARGIPPFPETRAYVNSVRKHWKRIALVGRSL